MKDQPPVPGGTTAIRGGQYITEERAPGPPTPKDVPMTEPMTESTPETRWQRTPRPLAFVRVRLHRGGQAEYIRDLLEDEKEELLADLGKLRGEGKLDGDADIEECRNNLRHLILALKDVSMGLIELVGEDGY